MKGKTEFQKFMMTEEERKVEILKDFTQDLLQEVEKLIDKQGKEEFLKLLL